jgi:hypothetical protein
MSRTLQQLADELNSLHAQAINIVEGTIAGAALPGGSISFTYRNPIDGQTYTATGTAWNTCSPSKVSALKLQDGSWIVIGAHESATVRTAVHTDRRARPNLPEDRGGLIMWLDVNWYSLALIDSPPKEVAAATRFLGGLLDYFLRGKEKKLYTLPSNDARIESNPDGVELFRQIVADKKITIVEASPIDAKGLYFAPLLLFRYQGHFWTSAELAALKRLARKHGVLCDGEWIGWVENDEAMLRGLGVRSSVIVPFSDDVHGRHDVQNQKFFRDPFQINCAATAFFGGLRPQEIVATVHGRPTIAYFRSQDLK